MKDGPANLFASVIAGLCGFFWLYLTAGKDSTRQRDPAAELSNN